MLRIDFCDVGLGDATMVKLLWNVVNFEPISFVFKPYLSSSSKRVIFGVDHRLVTQIYRLMTTLTSRRPTRGGSLQVWYQSLGYVLSVESFVVCGSVSKLFFNWSFVEFSCILKFFCVPRVDCLRMPPRIELRRSNHVFVRGRGTSRVEG